MYNDTLNGGMFNGRDMEELPEAIGPVAQLQEKLYVPVKEYPDVSGRLNSLPSVWRSFWVPPSLRKNSRKESPAHKQADLSTIFYLKKLISL